MTTPTPYYQSERVTLYCGDCLSILPHLSGVDAVVSDVPYGMSYVGSPGTSNGSSIHCSPKTLRTRETVVGDTGEFDPTPWLRWPVAFSGAQHYYHTLPAGGSLHSWDKRGDYKRTTFADADFIWCSRKMNAQTFRLVWRGLCRHAENTDRIEHPTQKPVSLMEWIISLLSLSNATILDPYMGSGSTGVAAINTGHKFIGCELVEGYCAIAKRRIQEAEQAFALFEPAKPEQQSEMFEVAK